jgi:hypothetical protein
MLEHDDTVGSLWDGSAGHDFPCGGSWKRSGWGLAGVGGPHDRERDVCGDFSGTAGVAIAGRARERGLIVVSDERRSENTASRREKT